MISDYIVTTLILHHVVATMTFVTIVAFHTVITFDNPLFALLTSSPVVWRKEQPWNFSVLQRVHISKLVYYIIYLMPETTCILDYVVHALLNFIDM
jgi:hypothetical protein